MSHCIKDNNTDTKRYAATIRMGEADKIGLRKMVDEYPLYNESVVMRAALQTFLALEPALRSRLILTSLQNEDIRLVLQRSGSVVK
ncbi:hypothetical protein [Ewingella americana]|jgi:hypothetical protein|uniref:hypothetical protein n=1 Tax=Ewingella americana TaxID=41202 RepID=UPI00163AE244|nr:hypothetical protein [Ewingella americana]QMV54182.1 hypothetical protein GXP68_23185 [Ewingella americana]